ncbi:copper resistance protein [Dictyobacter sp. S3.2.2.5]|uniref:Copper resistance protein n=2 Tax=Dictyobacter halimunensis TaxID=3026934 RepID=A0ABQ6FQU1_9CHLR|nr:copper resistance protein [Dictyobacter sp. S3.2.2.5]
MFFLRHGSALRRSGTVVLLTMLLLVCASIAASPKAFASPTLAWHAQYDHSNPAANAHLPAGQSPTFVQVWFTETIDPHFSTLKVYNPARQRVDLDDSRTSSDGYTLRISLRPHLPDATYTVVYSNISSEDGHHVQGAFSFVVGTGPLVANTDALLAQEQGGENNLNAWSVGLRWLNYLGMALLLGTVAFVLLVWRPASTSLRDHSDAAIGKTDVQIEFRALRLICGSIAVLFALTLAFGIYQAAFASESAPWNIISNGALGNVLFQSRFGIIWWLRLALILPAGGTALLCWRALFRHARRPRRLYSLLLILSIAMMGTTSLDAHAAAQADAWLLLPFDLIHLVSTGFWIGGVCCFVVLVPAGLRLLAPEKTARSRLLAALLPRFSRIAILCVTLLVITGTIQASFMLGSWANLVESGYGRTLIVKLVLFALILVPGALHLLRIGPRMQAANASTPTHDQVDAQQEGTEAATTRRLQRIFKASITLEATLAVCLLLIVGVLTSMSPPPPVTATGTGNTDSRAPLTYQGKMADLRYSLVVNPGQVGENTFEMALKQSNGAPLTHVDAVSIRLTMLDMDMGTQELNLTPIAGQPGQYQGEDATLGMSGHWNMVILVSRPGFNDATSSIDFSLP